MSKKSEQKSSKKKGFKSPHILWIMIILILVVSLLTYIIPAGEFAKDTNGKLIGDQFTFLDKQHPVNPWRAMTLIQDGLVGAAYIIAAILAIGGSFNVMLSTNFMEDFLNCASYKLQDKGVKVLVPALFFIMGYIGGFGGSDALIAMVPVGIIFAKKLKLDPIVAIGLTTFASLIGFATGPMQVWIAQGMIGIPLYSGFLVRFLSMNFFLLVGLFFLMRYIKKIQKDPSKSIMGDEDWLKEIETGEHLTKVYKLRWQTIVTLILFFGQYVATVILGIKFPYQAMNFTVAIFFLNALLIGVINQMKFEDIGNNFAKGVGNIAFVTFIIGLAKAVSLIMAEGQIVHTIVYALTRPLLNLNGGLITIGITAIIAVMDIAIPSASAKIAILFPILQPMGEALKIDPQLMVSAYQYGDGWSNIISPILGWTVGSAVMAKVALDKWIRWSFPKALVFLLLSFVWLFVLYEIGWTGV